MLIQTPTETMNGTYHITVNQCEVHLPFFYPRCNGAFVYAAKILIRMQECNLSLNMQKNLSIRPIL